MAEYCFLIRRQKEKAHFDFFFRNNPFGSGFTIFAGLQNLLEMIQDFSRILLYHKQFDQGSEKKPTYFESAFFLTSCINPRRYYNSVL
jgi:nicotinic acid phosphoribosyltransferase